METKKLTSEDLAKGEVRAFLNQSEKSFYHYPAIEKITAILRKEFLPEESETDFSADSLDHRSRLLFNQIRAEVIAKIVSLGDEVGNFLETKKQW